MTKYIFSIAFMSCLLLSTISDAQQSGLPLGGQFTITTNPSYFVLGGYHVSPAYHFPKRWSIEMTLQGGFELPDFARDDFFEHNQDQLVVDWKYAISSEVKYRFSKATFDKGLYASASLGYEAWDANNENANDEFENWFTSISLGYNWYPFKQERLHFGLRYSLIFILNNTDERELGETFYKIKNIIPPSFAPSIFVGWRF